MNLPVNPIPVTIIAGFLGSGKTTFINDLTAKHPGKKFAIIENEFGEISIDQELLRSGPENVFDITGGCICCSVSDTLLRYLLSLHVKSEKIDHLIIEASGVAEPLSIAEPFLTHPLIQQKYRLDSIVCLLDSQLVEEQLEQEEVVARQISAADVLLFNKADTITPANLQALESRMRQINPLASTHPSVQGHIAGTNLLELKANTPALLEKLQQEVEAHHHHLHKGIASMSIRFPEALDLAKLNQWANKLMLFQSSRIYRIKGILNVYGENRKMIFQGVKRSYALSPGSPWGATEERESKLVIIGRELQKERLQQQLKQCFVRR